MMRIDSDKFKLLISNLEDFNPATRKAFFTEGTSNYPVGSPDAFLLWWFFYFKDDFITHLADFHYEWIEYLCGDLDILIEGFRGSIKTALTIAVVSYRISNNLNKFIVWKSFEYSASVRNTTTIAVNLMNERLEKDYGVLFSVKGSKEELDKKSAGEFDTTNGVKVLANSLGEKLRGANSKKTRPDLLILDDIDVDDSVNNPDLISKNYRKLTGETFGALDKEKSQIFFLGNTIGIDGIVPRFKKDKKHSEYWKIFRQPLFYEDGKVTWDFFTDDMINKIRAKETAIAFSQNYDLIPYNKFENGKISPEMVRYYDTVDLSDFSELYAHADTTHTGKDTSDFFCLCMIGLNKKDNNFYVIDFILEKLDVEAQSRRTIIFYQKYAHLLKKFTYDEKANQGFGMWIKRLARDEYNISLPIEELKYSKDKIAHFDVHVPHFVANRVYLPSRHKDILIAEQQLFGFPTKGLHDDFVDGFSGAMDKLVKPQGVLPSPEAQIGFSKMI